MKKYEKPEIEIVFFENDVFTESGDDNNVLLPEDEF